MLPVFNNVSPTTASVPTPPNPGDKVPPSSTVNGPVMEPVPPKLAPDLTSTALLPVAEPELLLTSKTPLLTVVGPV